MAGTDDKKTRINSTTNKNANFCPTMVIGFHEMNTNFILEKQKARNYFKNIFLLYFFMYSCKVL